MQHAVCTSTVAPADNLDRQRGGCMPLEPSSIKSPPLYQRARDVLRLAILRGQLRPGERLAETQLAEQLGISRTPLREALRQLQAEGLLRQDEGGLVVPTLDLAEVELMYECRIALECLAASRAAERAGEESLARMAAALKDARAAIRRGDLPELLGVNVGFHREIALAGGNPWTLRLLEQLWSQMVLFRANVLGAPEDEEQVLREHEGVLERIAAHDPEGAAARMEAHLKGDLVRGRRALARARSGPQGLEEVVG